MTINTNEYNIIFFMKVGIWVAYVIVSFTMVLTIPLCYVNDQIMQLVNDQAFPGWLSSLLHILTIDHSGATIICLAVFFGVLLKYFENRGRLYDITTAFFQENTRSKFRKDDHTLDMLFSHIEAGKDVRLGVARFEEQLYWETRIDQYENYLVALGLIGTLLAFYLGFATELEEGLSFINLDTTVTKLLIVVGTAAISSVSGIGLGMLFVRPLADDTMKRIQDVVNAALKTLEVQRRNSDNVSTE